MKCFGLAWLMLVAEIASADVSIERPWARATPPNATVGVVYVTMRSSVPDEIVAISSSVAERVEVHTTVNEGGTMKMRPASKVVLPASQAVRFESGGLHIMLIGLRAPLVAGTHFQLDLQLRSGTRQSIRVPVIAPTDAVPIR